jgi:RNA polymerase sigma-70 factor (ECF subfamily)
MPIPSRKDVTDLLVDWSMGDQEALNKLMPLVYDELHRLASRYLRHERPGHTLQTTALVHEAYLKLVDQKTANLQNRVQFFAIAAQVMRHILVDYARSRRAFKRGGDYCRLSLDEAVLSSEEADADLLTLNEALNRLAAIDPQQSRVVELRVFGGLTVEETAEALAVSSRTVKREWSMANVAASEDQRSVTQLTDKRNKTLPCHLSHLPV